MTEDMTEDILYKFCFLETYRYEIQIINQNLMCIIFFSPSKYKLMFNQRKSANASSMLLMCRFGFLVQVREASKNY